MVEVDIKKLHFQSICVIIMQICGVLGMKYNIVDMIDSFIINNNLGCLSVCQKSCLQKMMTTLIEEFDGLRIDGKLPRLNSDTFYHKCEGINTDKIGIWLRNRKGQKFFLTISNEKITMVEAQKCTDMNGNFYSIQLPSGFSLELDVKSTGRCYKLNTSCNDYLISIEKDSDCKDAITIRIYDKSKIDNQGSIVGLEPLDERQVEISLEKGAVLAYPHGRNLFEIPPKIKSVLSYGQIITPYYLGKVYAAVYKQNHRTRDTLVVQLKKYVDKKDKLYRLRDKEICWVEDTLDSKLEILEGLELDEDFSNVYPEERNTFIVKNAKGKRFKLSLLNQSLELFELPDSIKKHELHNFDSSIMCYHNAFMLRYTPTDCSIKYVSGDDVVFVNANHLDIKIKRDGLNPIGEVIYDVDLYTNTADMDFPTGVFTSRCGMIVVEKDPETGKREEYVVKEPNMIESDYSGRFTLASNYAVGDIGGTKKPGLVVDLNRKPMFSLRNEPVEHIRVPKLMQRIGEAARNKYYMDFPGNHISDAVNK